ncbi:hypothetical protein BZA77DRAFT_172925 [Pyronema omphalodes]|nr:hypothetical protein BZA77DRAFT_172925 [Pyronema omphalodes]
MKTILSLTGLIALVAAQGASIFGNENCFPSGLNPTLFTTVDNCIREAYLHNDRALWLPTDGSCISPCITSNAIQICGGTVSPGGSQRWVSSHVVALTAEKLMNLCGSKQVPETYKGVSYELTGALRIQVGQGW